ncbi:acyltransferase [Actinomadura fulvescens]|uniref:Acyltransferase n=2 Tax=Actinomadura fulvescens TaxID=46160 RepID=A0ABP6BT71_9ACTN
MRLPSLTGMRFFAAFLVFLCHACVLGFFDQQTEASLRDLAFTSGWMGVEFFFILSGFVLTWSAREGQTRVRFWRRRLVKVYPNHVLVWLAAVGLAVWAGETVGLVELLPNLLLAHTWYPRLDVLVPINVVTWSLACDVFFYLAFPFLYAAVRKIPARLLWTSAAVVAGTIVLLPAVAYFALPGTPQLPGQNMSVVQNWFLVSFPPIRALDFTLGIIMARIVWEGRWIGLGIGQGLGLLAVGYAFQVYLWPSVYGLTATVVVPLALLISAVAVADVRDTVSPFRGRTLQWLGAVSFASYLVHYLVLRYAHVALGADRSWNVLPAVGLLAVLFAITTVLAWALFRFVELPSMRRWAAPRRRDSGSTPRPQVRSPERTG